VFFMQQKEFRMSTHATGARVSPDVDAGPRRRVSTETKASFKTTEMIVYVLSVIAVLIASEVVDDGDFNAKQAWFFVTLLTIGYMISRGLAKSGSRDYYDDRG
jgi:heme/copper-type cytochrome/quinol oxidase subunit 4